MQYLHYVISFNTFRILLQNTMTEDYYCLSNAYSQNVIPTYFYIYIYFMIHLTAFISIKVFNTKPTPRWGLIVCVSVRHKAKNVSRPTFISLSISHKATELTTNL